MTAPPGTPPTRPGTTRPWWQDGTVYQIYPRSFRHGGSGAHPGVGDLAGVTAGLDHLAWLGIDAVWLSPVFRSPMKDFGYDVADYCDIDPTFGTLEDLDRLVTEAHRRGIRVILDWVPNHTSDEHPWFVESRSDRTNPRRDWYVWRDLGPGGAAPNNWTCEFLYRSAWTLDERTGQAYLHCFLPEQPDLNWDHPDVRAAMHDVLRFWLDRGIDGFRCDVVHLLGKDLAVDDPVDGSFRAHVPYNDVEVTHDRLRELRALVDAYPGDRMLVGEVVIFDPERYARYVRPDELHLAFNFSALYTGWRADSWRRRVEEVQRQLGGAQGWPTWVLSNHDIVRHRQRYGGGEGAARAAAVLLLTLRGTPFLYAGEELGLVDADVPDHRRVDPGGRDGCRAPLPWTADAPHHGWAADPWLPFPPEATVRSVAAQREDPRSVLHLYRALLALRRSSPALHAGDLRWIDAPDGVLAWERVHPASGDRRLVAVNTTDEPRSLTVGPATVTVRSTMVGVDTLFDGRLGPDEAVVLRPLV